MATASRLIRRPRPPRSRAAAAGLAACAVVLGAGLGAERAEAVDWDVIPRVSLRATLSDNIDLDPPGDESSGFVWQVNPALSIHNREQGGRVKLDFDYSPVGLRYGSDTDRRSNGVSHRGQARANVEAVDQRLFLDLRAGASQLNNDRTAPRVVDEVAPSGNLSQSYYYGLSPYYLHHFGDFGDAELRYRYDQVLYDGTSPDSVTDGVTVSFNSGTYFPRFGWGVAYNERKVDYDSESRDDQTFEDITGRVSYPFNSQWSAFATLGYEDNDYRTRYADTSGRTWSAGFDYTPTERTALEVGYTDRSFGDNWFFDLSHRSHRTVWTARYRENLTTTSDVLLEQQLVPIVDEFGNRIRDPLSGADLFVPTDIPTLTTDTLVRKRLEGSVSLKARRTTTTLRVYHDDRQYQESGEEDKVLGSTLRISRRLDRETTGVILATWQRSQYEPESEEETYWNVGLRLSRELTRDLRGTLDVRHQENAADRTVNEYRENRITAGLTYTF